MKNLGFKIFAYIIVVGLTYIFLTICNWTDNPMDWNGLSRVILALSIVGGIKIFID